MVVRFWVQCRYPHHPLFGLSTDPFIFHFCHGDLHHRNILIDPSTGKITGIIDWECAGFRSWWTDVPGVRWLAEDQKIRHAFFRVELYKRNPDLFSCFLGGVELCPLPRAATDSNHEMETERIANAKNGVTVSAAA